jgi:RNA chaperone Hfq
MASQSKSEKVKIWIKEYLSEFGEYSGTLEELANLANASPYLIKKALSNLEEEGFLKAESKKGKGLLIALVNKEEPKGGEELKESEVQEVPAVEEIKPQPDEKEEKKKKKVSLQDRVLSSLIGKDVVVFLISGTRLEGKLLDFDNFTLSMTAPKGKSLVYKHAIATIIFE